jgi:aspartate aminotransferase-like enzyme
MLWIPGPTEVRPEILAECARPAIGHRSPAMAELIERIDTQLPLAFGLSAGSSARLAVHSCSATGLMEASLRGVGSRVLAVVNGAFSARYATVAKLLGKEVRMLDVEWGRGVDPDRLEEVLAEEGPFDALTIVSNETSTGVLTPLAPVARVLESFPETTLLVDLVSTLAGAPVNFDANRIDFGFAGVQKALALPPGLSILCCSSRYLDSARSRELRGWYLDPVRIVEGHEARKPPATPVTPLYHALARQLEDISGGVTLPTRDRDQRGTAAWQARFDRHVRMRDRVIEWAAGHGLSPFPAAEFLSPTVSCISAEKIEVSAFVEGLAKLGFEISGGYGELKNSTFRIGHLGDHTEEGLEALLAAADSVLRQLHQRPSR